LNKIIIHAASRRVMINLTLATINESSYIFLISCYVLDDKENMEAAARTQFTEWNQFIIKS